MKKHAGDPLDDLEGACEDWASDLEGGVEDLQDDQGCRLGFRGFRSARVACAHTKASVSRAALHRRDKTTGQGGHPPKMPQQAPSGVRKAQKEKPSA